MISCKKINVLMYYILCLNEYQYLPKMAEIENLSLIQGS